jgi:anti-anti-sigma factor
MESIVAVVTVANPSVSPLSPSRIREAPPRVWFQPSRISSSTVIAAWGEIDAWNQDDAAAYVMSHLGECSQLLLDFSELTFFAIPGFSMLHDVHLECAARNIPWIVVPSAEVRRVLRICDARATLPVAHTASAGMNTLDGGPRRHLQLL